MIKTQNNTELKKDNHLFLFHPRLSVATLKEFDEIFGQIFGHFFLSLWANCCRGVILTIKYIFLGGGLIINFFLLLKTYFHKPPKIMGGPRWEDNHRKWN